MLTDPKEIEIISRARQKNVRDHRRSREHFTRIFADFLAGVAMQGQRLVDMGPGQYDFGVLARERGAETVGLDHDEAVLELGRHKGFEVRDYKLQALAAGDFDRPFDGVFNKFAWNAFWFHDDEARHREAIGAIGGMLAADGWGWIAPWNGVPKNADLSAARIAEVLALQAALFAEQGFEGYDLGDELARRYGVHGTVANNALFVRGLGAPPVLRGLARL